MATVVIGEWKEWHQKFVEDWCQRHIDRKLREMEEAEKNAAAEAAENTEQVDG